MTDAHGAFRRRPPVGCDEASEAISARFDDEKLPIAGPGLDAHLAGCPACRDFEAQLAGLGRRLRMRSARPVPQDLAANLVPTLEASPRPSRRPVWRLD
jgi:predicted anti-sigma-YlaC factor YlaD